MSSDDDKARYARLAEAIEHIGEHLAADRNWKARVWAAIEKERIKQFERQLVDALPNAQDWDILRTLAQREADGLSEGNGGELRRTFLDLAEKCARVQAILDDQARTKPRAGGK